MKRRFIITTLALSAYSMFLLISWIIDFSPGEEIGANFVFFALTMLRILPCAFILIGLFEVWVKKETIERHFGERSGIKGYIWALLLAGTTVGGLYVAFPVAYSLCTKGARLSVIFTLISSAAICRIPMTIFEASFLGIKFSLVRLLVSIPLVIITATLLGNYLARRGYQMKQPEAPGKSPKQQEH